ncbi:type IVB secretion system protein IcmH/DotU [Pseudoalteromonas tunicata]|uniref:type IVB secretion system protein IcmH/DotU n=1 Tax=Pseudoalteromonas tunicata TaxID=314281 RepID=UPI00273D9BA1|nr:type IVB secretion system protein IcmH/DotU [Pseudoalteromonas tunicata]MDP5214960.1 type IVB secretion system protein IcmH/DotU [Pseudoalteromonas tunicata]
MKLINAFIPVLSYLKSITGLLTESSELDQEQLQQQLMPQLIKYKETLLNNGYSSEQFETALFAICALIDEAVLISEWKYKDNWLKNPLQKQFFETNSAGVEFFEKLDNLKELNTKDQDIREVYFYCLTFGFAGCYFDIGQKSQLNDIIQANYKLLNNYQEIKLFNPKIPSNQVTLVDQQMHEYYKRKLFTWGPIVFLVASFFYFRNDFLSVLYTFISSI